MTTFFAGQEVDAADLEAMVSRAYFLAPLGTPSIPNSAVTYLTPGTPDYNVQNMWASGTNLTVPANMGGRFNVGMVLRFATNATGVRQARFEKNTVEYIQWDMPAISGFNTVVGGVMPVKLVPGDVIRFGAFQTSGGALALTGNSYVWMERDIQS